MSLQRYFQTINNINPGKIYVENVRSISKLPRFVAKLVCEMAVKEKLFIKKFGVVCPVCNRIIAEYNSITDIPEEIYCQICDAEDEENSVYQTNKLRIEQYYKLNY